MDINSYRSLSTYYGLQVGITVPMEWMRKLHFRKAELLAYEFLKVLSGCDTSNASESPTATFTIVFDLVIHVLLISFCLENGSCRHFLCMYKQPVSSMT